MTVVRMTVNGRAVEEDVEPRMLLVDLLRDRLGLTGTHVGCDTSQCGACVVHVDARSTKACTMLAVQADGCTVLTIEGVGRADALHPLQHAFREAHALQCGFCTPGMIMSALDLLGRGDLLGSGEPLDEARVRSWLDGNLCRCTGYQGIVEAILAVASANAEGSSTTPTVS